MLRGLHGCHFMFLDTVFTVQLLTCLLFRICSVDNDHSFFTAHLDSCKDSGEFSIPTEL